MHNQMGRPAPVGARLNGYMSILNHKPHFPIQSAIAQKKQPQMLFFESVVYSIRTVWAVQSESKKSLRPRRPLDPPKTACTVS